MLHLGQLLTRQRQHLKRLQIKNKKSILENKRIILKNERAVFCMLYKATPHIKYYSTPSNTVLSENVLEDLENNFIENLIRRQRTSLEAIRRSFDDNEKSDLDTLKQEYDQEKKTNPLRTSQAEVIAKLLIDKYITPEESEDKKVESFKKLIQIFIGYHELDIALLLFRRMEVDALPIEKSIYYLILYGLYNQGNSMLFDGFLGKLSNRIGMDEFSYNLTLKMYGQNGLITRPDVVFRNMKTYGLKASISTCNILLEQYSASLEYKSYADMVYKHIQELEMTPNFKTFYYLLKCMNNINTLNDIIEWMVQLSVPINDQILSAYIIGLKHSKKLEGIEEQVNSFADQYLDSKLGVRSTYELFDVLITREEYSKAFDYLDRLAADESIDISRSFCHLVALLLLHDRRKKNEVANKTIRQWVVRYKDDLTKHSKLDAFDRKEWKVHLLAWRASFE